MQKRPSNAPKWIPHRTRDGTMNKKHQRLQTLVSAIWSAFSSTVQFFIQLSVLEWSSCYAVLREIFIILCTCCFMVCECTWPFRREGKSEIANLQFALWKTARGRPYGDFSGTCFVLAFLFSEFEYRVDGKLMGVNFCLYIIYMETFCIIVVHFKSLFTVFLILWIFQENWLV